MAWPTSRAYEPIRSYGGQVEPPKPGRSMQKQGRWEREATWCQPSLESSSPWRNTTAVPLPAYSRTRMLRLAGIWMSRTVARRILCVQPLACSRHAPFRANANQPLSAWADEQRLRRDPDRALGIEQA